MPKPTCVLNLNDGISCSFQVFRPKSLAFLMPFSIFFGEIHQLAKCGTIPLHPTIPTVMSAFLCRAKIAVLCSLFFFLSSVRPLEVDSQDIISTVKNKVDMCSGGIG